MTTLEKCKLAVEKGYKYNEYTGEVIGVRGEVLISKHSKGYYNIRLRNGKKTTTLKSHQFAWYIKYNEIPPIIDHINRDKSDNRIVNLRVITNQQNCYNTNAKGYTIRNGKYRSQIQYNGKKIHLGSFNTEEEARDVYINAKKIYHIYE